MRSLANWSGIDIEWATDGTLTFDKDLIVDETLQRPRERLRAVALQPEVCEPALQPQYLMYNGIVRRADRERLAVTGMRYELTLMFPYAIGRERAKTLGHLHSAPPNSPLNYPEVCEVLHGTAYFVFQTMDTDTRSAPYCAVLEAHPGDKVIIPPNLHHLTINAGDEPLLFADVIPLATRGIYESLAAMHGAAYLNTLDAGWIKNPHYVSMGDLQHWPADAYPVFGLMPDRPLYNVFSDSPDKLAWMLRPEQFGTTFPTIWQRLEAVIAA